MKGVRWVMILSVVVTHNVQGTALLKAKLGLLKAKTVAVAAPHVAAKIAVAKEIKAKKAFAFAQAVAAIKAKKAATLAVLTAPFKVAKKTVVLKAGALAAAKALKVAKVAHVVGSLKKPILIPVGIPIPVPVKLPLPIPFKDPIATLGAGALGFGAGLKAGSAAGVGAGTVGLGAGAAGLGAGAAGLGAGAAGLGAGALGTGAGLLGAGLGSAGLGSGLLGSAISSGLGVARGATDVAATGASGLLGGALSTLTNPVQGLLNGAQSILQGSLPPFLSTLTNGVASRATVPSQYAVPEAHQEPVYQNHVTIFFFVSVISSTTLAFELTCRYKTETNWWAINNVYFCDLKYGVETLQPKEVITTVNGCHLHDKSNSDVVGFRASNKQLEYFPKGLPNHFDAEKIEFIAVWETGLKEIHQSDLQPFTKLRILSLWANDFEVIERDLLKFNPRIEYIGLGKNKIKFIDGNVFGHLNALHSLHIDSNKCISREVAGDRGAVLDLLKEIQEKCSGSNDVAFGDYDFKFDVRTSI
ncbi:hypothetical protein HA402_016116 [Bradysia odoriphaga]|nr:hypothetical protein HA402_016116 [Bradysia odoriphaga]